MNLGNKKKKGTEKDVWLTKYWNISFLATKSVSQLSSITAALVSFCASASKPWAAVRADIFEAKTFPLFLSSFWAASASTTTQLKKRKPFFQGNPWRKKQRFYQCPNCSQWEPPWHPWLENWSSPSTAWSDSCARKRALQHWIFSGRCQTDTVNRHHPNKGDFVLPMWNCWGSYGGWWEGVWRLESKPFGNFRWM